MWLWRGTQSAIFYYVSFSPCLEYNHKRKRRKEASKSQKQRDQLELLQPGVIQQPVPFQTNQFWAEEVEAGPGPPRGWRKHSLDDRAKRERNGKKNKGKNARKSVFSSEGHGSARKPSPPTTSSSKTVPAAGDIQSARTSRRASDIAGASPLDALKDTLRSTIALPDTWNWKRYEREDETLFGINDKISRIWGRATHQGRQVPADGPQTPPPGRKRASAAESDNHDWLYARNPGVNDLHPPTVSQLPRTKREVAWMMQPPPSRAVMEGKVRPGTESGNRRAMCMIGGVPAPSLEHDPCEAKERKHMSSVANKKQPPDLPVSPGGNENVQAEDEGDSEDAEIDTQEATSADYSLYSRSSANHQLSSTSQLPPSPLSSRDSAALRRPPLAVLVGSSSAVKFQSYQLPMQSPKLLNPQSDSPPPAPELDILMGVVLPKMPQRSRYSLPNVRLGEG